MKITIDDKAVILLALIVFSVAIIPDVVEASLLDDILNWFTTEEKVIVTDKYDYTSHTHCENKVCTSTMYSNVEFVQENGDWVNVENAKSLKGTPIHIEYLEIDDNLELDVVDYNLTSITVRLGSKDDGNIPVRIWEKDELKTETFLGENKGLDVSAVKRSYKQTHNLGKYEEVSLKLDENVVKTYDFGFDKVFEYGHNSTTISLSSYPYESAGDVRIYGGNNYGGQGKFNLTWIPAGVGIVNSTACYYNFENYGAFDDDLNVSRVADQVWDAQVIADTSYVAGQVTTNANTVTMNSTAVSSWMCFNVTDIVHADFDIGNDNTTIRFVDNDYNINTITSISVAGEINLGTDAAFPAGPYCKIGTADGGGGTPAGKNPVLTIVYEDPVITLDVQSPTNTTYPSLDINVTAVTDTATTIKYNINLGGNHTLCSGCTSGETSTSTDVQEGGNNITVYAEASGVMRGAESSVFFSVDTTQPNIKIENPSGMYRQNTSIPIDYNVTDSLSGVDKCQYQLNTSTPTNTSLAGCGNTTLPGTQTAYAGDYVITIFANDTAGNENKTQSTFSYWPLQNVSALDSITGFPIESFQILVVEPSKLYSTTNETLNMPFDEIGIGTRTFRFYADGYNTTDFTFTLNDTSKINETLTVSPSYLNMFVFDEQEKSLGNDVKVIFNATLSNLTFSKTFIDNDPFFEYLNETPTGDVTVDLSAYGYSNRRYSYTLEDDNAYNTTAYMLKTTDSILVRFHILTITETGIEGANVVAERFLDSAWTTIGEQETDESGTASFYLYPSASYRISVTATGYDDKTVTITPSDNDYTIYMTSGDTGEPMEDRYTNITMIQTPTNLLLNATTQEFICWVLSTEESLDYVGMNLTHGNGTVWYSNITATTSGIRINYTIDLTYENNTNITSDCFFRRTAYDWYNSTRTYGIMNITDTDLDTATDLLRGNLWLMTRIIIVTILTIAAMGFTIKFTGNVAAAGIVGIGMMGIFNYYFALFEWRIYYMLLLTYASIIYLGR